jgi:hypothetical protein
MLYRSLFFLAASLLLSSCASLTPREIAYVEARGVPAPVVYKLERNDPLTPRDIIALSQSGTPDRLIIRALEGAGVDYLVTDADVLRLRRSGVSALVIDVLLLECDRFARSYAEPAVDVSFGMWWTDSGYYGPSSYYFW